MITEKEITDHLLEKSKWISGEYFTIFTAGVRFAEEYKAKTSVYNIEDKELNDRYIKDDDFLEDEDDKC